MGPTTSLPVVPRPPDHPPVAVQAVTPVLLHDSVLVPFATTDCGTASSRRLTGCTVIVALRAMEPPAPVQVSVYVAVAVCAPVLSLPDVARPPDHAPDATQLVAFVVDQVSWATAPVGTVA